MTRILHIDTANRFCSVALSEDEKLTGLRETNENNAHSRVVTVFMDELLKSKNLKPAQLDAIAVSMGPGSYTGLRIGVSAAKGLCYALEKPLIAVSTLQAMALAGIEKAKNEMDVNENMHFCPMIDARRMEVYSALYDHTGKPVRDVKAEIIDAYSYQKEIEKQPILFSGDGSAKCKDVIPSGPNVIFQNNVQPSAKFMIPFAFEKFQAGQFEDTAYFEPFYLKSFVAGLPKVKGLR